jgi:hypothetical protein
VRFRLGLLFTMLVLPIMGYSQSTLLFPKLFSPSELPNTGFAIVNPGSAAATVTFTLYGPGGQIVSTYAMVIGAGGQKAQAGSELFSNTGNGGWVKATSSATGLQGFWLNYNGSLTLIDGAEAASMATEVVIPLVAGQTEVNVANPNAVSTPITLRLYGSDGLEMAAAVTGNVAANGVFQSQASSLFPSANLPQAQYIRITSGAGPVAATALITGYLVPTESAVVNGVDRSANITEANFPHVISGELTGANYTTVIGVTNLSASSQTVTLTFTPTTGAPISVPPTTLPGNGSLRATAKDLFDLPAGFQDGWVKITGTAPLTGFAAYGDTIAGALAVVPVGSAKSSLVFAHIADGPAIAAPWQTGLAFLNTSATTANIEIYAMTAEGQLIGKNTNVTLAPGKKIADQLHNWIPQTRGINGGFVFARTTNNVPLFGIELFYTEDLKILSNVAAGALAPGITYTPPVTLSLTSISPASAVRGAAITLTGTGFSSTVSNNIVVFTSASGTVETTAATATSTTLTVAVPSTAISGPVLVRNGGSSSSSKVLEIAGLPSTALPSPITVQNSATTGNVDIVVDTAASNLNITQLGLYDVGAASYQTTAGSVEIVRGQTKEFAVIAGGVSQALGSTVTISGAGVSITNVRYESDRMVVRIAVNVNAVPGVRNVMVTNTNSDVSVFTGGLFIR